jgi:O-antigen/teichoic acid export membrane protein
VTEVAEPTGLSSAAPSMLKQLVQNTVFAGATKFAGLLISLVSVAITSRLLGPEGRGYLAVVSSVVGMVATLGNLSLGQVALSHGAGERDENWLPSSVGVLMMVAVIVSAVAVIGIGIAMSLGYGKSMVGIPPLYLVLGFAGLPLTIWTTYSSYLLFAADDVRSSNLSQLTGALASLLSVVALVLFLKRGVEGSLVATLIGLLANTVVGGYYLLKATRRRLLVSMPLMKRYLTDGMKLHLTSIGAFMFSSLDILMVHHYRGPSDAGVFQLASQLYLPLLLVPQALGEVLSGKLGTLGPRGLWQVQRRLMLIAVVVMAAASALLAVAAPLVVRILAGPAFAGSVPILRIYLLVIVGGTINTTMGVQWIGRGLFLQTSLLTFGAGLANFLFNLAFIPRFGARGAAMATVVGVYAVPVCANLFLMWRCEWEYRAATAHPLSLGTVEAS